MTTRNAALVLVVLAVLLVGYAAMNFSIDTGNKRALLAVAAAGACTTAAAWIYARMRARTA